MFDHVPFAASPTSVMQFAGPLQSKAYPPQLSGNQQFPALGSVVSFAESPPHTIWTCESRFPSTFLSLALLEIDLLLRLDCPDAGLVGPRGSPSRTPPFWFSSVLMSVVCCSLPPGLQQAPCYSPTGSKRSFPLRFFRNKVPSRLRYFQADVFPNFLWPAKFPPGRRPSAASPCLGPRPASIRHNEHDVRNVGSPIFVDSGVLPNLWGRTCGLEPRLLPQLCGI